MDRYRFINQGIKTIVVITETENALTISTERWKSSERNEINVLEKFMELHHMTLSRQQTFEQRLASKYAKAIKNTQIYRYGNVIINTFTAVHDDALFWREFGGPSSVDVNCHCTVYYGFDNLAVGILEGNDRLTFYHDTKPVLEMFMQLHQETIDRFAAFKHESTFRCADVVKKTETIPSGKMITTFTTVNNDALFWNLFNEPDFFVGHGYRLVHRINNDLIIGVMETNDQLSFFYKPRPGRQHVYRDLARDKEQFSKLVYEPRRLFKEKAAESI